MYQEQEAVFIYCVSPVHMGAGTALGVIDNPIQRERHTAYPVFAGSGLKGAVRHHFRTQARKSEGGGKESERLVRRIFGPEPQDGGPDAAGAISFSDAQLLCFPVRSVREAFVYTTSPTALARALRLLHLAKKAANWKIPDVQVGRCLVSDKRLCSGDRLPLEAFEFAATEDPAVKKVAEDLARMAFPSQEAFKFFAERMKKALVVLSDEDFGYFVRNTTVVEPHVRIDDVTGTADDGGLFYTENLPPESLLIGVVMASDERSEKDPLPACDVMETVIRGKAGFEGLDERMVQVGGDATTGRGQVVFKSTGGNGNA